MHPDTGSLDRGGVRLGLPKKRRLVQRREFLRVKDSGKRLAVGSLVLNWIELPEGSGSKLGVITTKALGGAVVRNLARRRMREAFRGMQHELLRPAWLVLIARGSIRKSTADQVRGDLRGILKRARLMAA